ncbi:SRPBCC family protein [Streptomyces sp. H10-C2]|uniref:SRPBCC family protein n=1 Tax=unclassified Streptomyces TaxID=2593676 RepID=UPI0024BB8512|nr:MULTISPECIES: SRPBCC family protein [unclassified Streptomyces]MDJ0342879.1 SRPBCC family protein [Streptomyces sp. PH10-H1]MDJ0372652.1 SRPBCC family protein [Streptomyces sp. H10-C2]
MARRSRPLRPVDTDFLDTAPVRLVFAHAITAPPEAVYRALAEDTGDWPAWFDAVKSARPTEAGRDIALAGGVRFEETVLVADAPRRYVYRADTCNAPGLRALLEEWRVEPAAAGSLVQWTFAMDGPAPLRLMLRVLRPGLGRAFRGAVQTLDRRLATA